MLSEFLKGRYGLSRSKALNVAQVIQLDSSDTQHFVNLLESEFHRVPGQRQLARLRVLERIKSDSAHVGRETLSHI